jgi:hypothetical protein
MLIQGTFIVASNCLSMRSSIYKISESGQRVANLETRGTPTAKSIQIQILIEIEKQKNERKVW